MLYRKKAVKDALDDVSFQQLPLVRLLWSKARRSGWVRDDIYLFVYKLFSGLSQTKTSQEDILQELSNLARANRRKDISLPRAFFKISTSERLSGLPCQTLRLDQGDIQSFGKLARPMGDDFTPKPSKRRQVDKLVETAASRLKSDPKELSMIWKAPACPVCFTSRLTRPK